MIYPRIISFILSIVCGLPSVRAAADRLLERPSWKAMTCCSPDHPRSLGGAPAQDDRALPWSGGGGGPRWGESRCDGSDSGTRPRVEGARGLRGRGCEVGADRAPGQVPELAAREPPWPWLGRRITRRRKGVSVREAEGVQTNVGTPRDAESARHAPATKLNGSHSNRYDPDGLELFGDSVHCIYQS